jgi:cyclohexa-1,5-dienecarbonyl-CoA hydratase
MILTGAALEARDPQVAPLVSVIAPRGQLVSSAEEWFERHLAPKSAAALRHAAAAARAGLVAHVQAVLPGLERLYLESLMRTRDAVEGIDAFIAKRKPAWTDR